jgi:hypothetical protein
MIWFLKKSGGDKDQIISRHKHCKPQINLFSTHLWGHVQQNLPRQSHQRSRFLLTLQTQFLHFVPKHEVSATRIRTNYN